MSSLWLKIWIWTKIAVFSLLTIYLLLFLYNNSDRTTHVWFWFRRDPEILTLLLAVVAFLTGVLGTILVRTTFKTLRQIRDVRERSRSERLEREVTDMRTKAAMLKTREATIADEARSKPVD